MAGTGDSPGEGLRPSSRGIARSSYGRDWGSNPHPACYPPHGAGSLMGVLCHTQWQAPIRFAALKARGALRGYPSAMAMTWFESMLGFTPKGLNMGAGEVLTDSQPPSA